MMSKFIQFELWKDCKQGCKFCCNKGQLPVDKSESCKYILEKLNTLEAGEYDYIGLIGGEFFNGEYKDHKDLFYQIVRKSIELSPKKLFITTSLIFNIGKYLIPFLKWVESELKAIDKVVLCTSWDAEYRFHTQEQRMTWNKNMLWLPNRFKGLELHVEMILTQHLIDLINDKGLNLDVFKRVFRCSIDFIEPSSGLYYTDKYECQKDIPGFFPTKASFVKFVLQNKDFLNLDTFLSMELRSDELYFLENGERRAALNRRAGDGRCELKDKSKKYDIGFIDSDASMRDVVNLIREDL